jgi:hypothetical protein
MIKWMTVDTSEQQQEEKAGIVCANNLNCRKCGSNLFLL